MKKFIKIGSILTLALMIGLISCKKENNVTPDKEQKEQMYVVKTQVPIVDRNGKKRIEKGIIIGTKKELDRVLDSSNGSTGVSMMVVGPNNHVFVVDKKPYDPKTECNMQIYNMKRAMWQQWQNEANETCTPVTNTLNCSYPYYLFSEPQTFTVYPSYSKCGYIRVFEKIKFPFEVNLGDGGFNYDSKEVYEYIQKL